MNLRMTSMHFPHGFQRRFDSADANLPSFCKVVLPNPDHSPTFFSQRLIHLEVSGLVLREFLLPEGPVICRHIGMFLTTVPEASIHKDHDAGLAKSEVWFSEKRLMPAPTDDFMCAQKHYERKFCFLISAPFDARHHI